jgi:cell division protein FtsI (penicillin-binding protein 3)
MNNKIRIICFFILLAFAAILTRLFYWQVIKAKGLADQARRQYQIGQTIMAPRGSILADDGSYLAGRGEGWLVYAYLPQLKLEINKIADLLAPLLVEDKQDDYQKEVLDESGRIKKLLSNNSLSWVLLKQKVDSTVKNNIQALDIGGVGFDREDLRIYPEASTAAQLLGFVGKNASGADQGYFGLEGYYDLVLSGKPGYLSRDSDANGSPIVAGEVSKVAAVDGVDLVTNINRGLQLQAEEKLKEGIEKYGAKAGTVIVMEPKTGAIKVMASFPSYDPFDYSNYSEDLFRNPAISDSFEPGSVFKVIIMASALDSESIKTDSICDVCSGPVKIDKYSIETWNNKYNPNSSMQDIIVHSDNVGMVFVGNKLGKDKMFDYLQKFGIGKLTGIDLQGESTSKLRDRGSWSDIDLATASFGQGIATTAIQITKAVAAIANKGIMVTPQVVAGLSSDGWNQSIKPKEEGRVIGQKAAEETTAMMVEAAKSGESKWTYLGGFGVAGKTGTAQIPIAGHYDAEKTIASFVGFAPFDDPKFVMMITLREPQSSPWASETAAPLWYNIAKDLFVYYKIQPK